MALKTLSINGRVWHFEVSKQSDDQIKICAHSDASPEKIEIMVNDYDYDALDGLVRFVANGMSYGSHIQQPSHGDEQWMVTPRSGAQPVAVQPCGQKSADSSLILPARHASGLHSGYSGNKNYLKSPLAGRVIKVCVAPAQLIKQGDVMILIESMKMNNEICANQTAFIKNILIAEGNVVQQGQILIEFEKEGEGNATTKSSNEQKAV